MFGGSPRNKIIKIGNYRIRKKIGEGNFAVVMLAYHETVKTKVAIKIIDWFRADAETRRMIDREVDVLKVIEHPHVIKLYEVIEVGGRIHLVTEFAGGGELYEKLLKRIRFSEKDARHYFRQVVSAVLYCHVNGIVHRDVKAENLLLDKNDKIKIIDFGFSTFTSGSPLSTFCGTPPYAAPELFQGKDYDGPKSDVWSLGVLLYVMVFGGYPFPASSFFHLRKAVISGQFPFPAGVSDACSDLIRKMLTVDFRQRISLEQVIQHEWFCADDWSLEADKDFAFLKTQPGRTPALVLNPDVKMFMFKKNYSEKRVKEALRQKLFDEVYATYCICCDKLQKFESRPSFPTQSAAPESCKVPNRGRRGSLTTGQVTVDLAQNTPVLSAVAMAVLEKSSDEESSDDEDTRLEIQESLTRSSHVLRGTHQRDDLSFAPYQTPLYPITFNAPYPLFKRVDHIWNLARVDLPEGNVFNRGWHRRCSESAVMQPLVSALAGNSAFDGGEPWEQVSNAELLQESESIEEKGAQYLRTRGGLKRHTLPANAAEAALNRGHSGSFLRCNSNSFPVGSQAGSVKRFFSPYPTSIRHEGASSSGSMYLNFTNLHRLEQLYREALQIPQAVDRISPVCRGEFSQFSDEEMVTTASAEGQPQHADLLGVGDGGLLQQKSTSAQSLHIISESDTETSGAVEMSAADDEYEADDGQRCFLATVKIDAPLEPLELLQPLEEVAVIPNSDPAAMVPKAEVDTSCNSYQQQPTMYVAETDTRPLAPAAEPDQHVQFCFGQYYVNVPETSAFSLSTSPICSSSSSLSSWQQSRSPYFVYGSMSQVVEKLKAVLDQMGVGYVERVEPEPLNSGDQRRDRRFCREVRQISLQNNENVRLNVGFSSSALSTGGVEIDFSYVEGYYGGYQALCSQLLNELKL